MVERAVDSSTLGSHLIQSICINLLYSRGNWSYNINKEMGLNKQIKEPGVTHI